MKKRVRVLSFCMALVMLFGVLPFAVSATQADTIAIGEIKDVNIDVAGKMVDFYFTPTETAPYAFWSTDNTMDTYGYIYNGETQVARNDDDGDGNNFKVEAELTAGVQYTLRARAYSSNVTGTMKVHVAKLVTPTKMETFDGKDEVKTNLASYLYAEPDFQPANCYQPPVTATSSNEKVVRAYEDQLFTVGAGTATVTFTTENGLKDTVKVTVLAPATIKVGDNIELSDLNNPAPTYKFVAPADGQYCFYSTGEGDPHVTIYDDKLNVLADSDDAFECMFYTVFECEKGKTYYFSLYNYEDGGMYTVHLIKRPSNAGFKAEYAEYKGVVGQSIYPNFIPNPMGCDVNLSSITYVSSDESIVQVNGSGLQPVAEGTATITAKNVDGLSTTFKVTVLAPTIIREEGIYNFESAKNHKYFAYKFIPQQSGDYYIGKFEDNCYIYISGASVRYDTLIGGDDVAIVSLVAGQECSIVIEGDYWGESSFYIYKVGTKFCGTEGHSWGGYTGPFAPTTLSNGYIERTCKVCGTLNYQNPPKFAATKDAAKQFKDVKKKNWFYDAVNFAYNSNLFAGTSKTEFSPNANMTRGMFVTVLGRLSGVEVNKKVTTKFKDVPKGQYYTGYVKWASEAGIVSGTSGTTFEPDANITREQICAMMVRYIDHVDLCLRNDTPVIKFKDEGKISKWAKKAVLACQKGGIVSGQKSGKGYIFNPQGNATRAEVATIIYNYVQNYLVSYLGYIGM